MSEAAKIILIDHGIVKPLNVITAELEAIKKWHNGKDYPIKVDINGKEIYDSVENLEAAINNQTLDEYINKELDKTLTLKTDGNSNLIVVTNPNYDFEGGKKKYRNPMRHLTPKKKRRK